MNEMEIIKRFSADQPMYAAWGEYVKRRVLQKLESLPNGINLVRIEVQPRVKDIDSLLEKAFRPGKNYRDPYNEITDKVGIRFVVLLESDIQIINDVISNIDCWECSVDRDYEEDRINHPTLFEYQSRHCIVKNIRDLEYKGKSIPANTPCEVQIRTLLQHAYSELSHDKIYKPVTNVIPEVHRIVARSMALIETTDQLFLEVNKMIASDEIYLEQLNEIYSKTILDLAAYERKANLIIIDSYRDYLFEGISSDISNYFNDNKWMIDLLQRKADYNFFYRQPAIMLLFYLVKDHKHCVRELWPYTEDTLRPIYSDLGHSM